MTLDVSDRHLRGELPDDPTEGCIPIEVYDLQQRAQAATLEKRYDEAHELLRQLAAIGSPPTPKKRAWSPGDILAQWRDEGPLIHVPTGLSRLDELTGGGPVFGTRWFLLGAPDAGKTMLLVQIADAYLDAGLAVGLLGIDEEPGDLLGRFAQRRGISRKACEERSIATLAAIDEMMRDRPIRYYDHDWTIDEAADDLAKFAEERGLRAFLGVDSLQTATASNEDPRASLREHVTQRAVAVRSAATRHRMIVMATSEMNRGAYRSNDATETTNDMAAAKESGAIEYQARVMLSLRSVPGESDLVDLKIVKSKHGGGGEHIGLRLDRGRQTIVEEEDYDPRAAADAQREAKAEARAAKARTKRLDDAAALASILATLPGLSGNKATRALQSKLGKCSRGRFNTAVLELGDGVTVRIGDRGTECHYLVGDQVPAEVLERLDARDRARVGNMRPPADEGGE